MSETKSNADVTWEMISRSEVLIALERVFKKHNWEFEERYGGFAAAVPKAIKAIPSYFAEIDLIFKKEVLAVLENVFHEYDKSFGESYGGFAAAVPKAIKDITPASNMLKTQLILGELLTKTLTATEELNKYNQIGTVEECREAVEAVKAATTTKNEDKRMTEDEALIVLTCERRVQPEHSVLKEALSLAISALEKIQQYRENETPTAEFDFDETEEELLRKYSSKKEDDNSPEKPNH